MNTSYLTPDEARTVFNEWIAEQSKNFVNPDNARFQMHIENVFEGRDIIRGIML